MCSRVSITTLLVVLMLSIVLGPRTLSPILAQDATPAAEVSFEPLSFASVAELPASPAIVGLARLTFPSGSVLPLEEGDPSLALVYVETGTLTVRIEGPITVYRAADDGAPEEIAAGTEFTAGPGDSFIGPAEIPGEARNDGTEPTVILAAIVEPDPAAEATPES